LYNPAIFSGKNPFIWDISNSYLDLCIKYPASMGIIKGHIFKVCNAAYSLFLFPFLSFHFNQNSNIPPSFFKLGYKNILSLEKKLEEQKVLKKLRRLFLN